jgi:hypothetical protein
MNQLLDCLVSYFGLDDEERPTYRRYFCYHVIAGPGPTEGAGVATITTVAISHEADRCRYCQHWHTVEQGGPEAAMAAAIHYLDVYHAEDHLQRAQSYIRGLPPARHERPSLPMPHRALQEIRRQ